MLLGKAYNSALPTQAIRRHSDAGMTSLMMQAERPKQARDWGMT